jgi:hypothetical protein
MNDRPDVDARLSRFLIEEAPPRAPERLIDATRHGVAGTRQRRRADTLRWRLSSTILTPAGVAVAALVIGLVGTSLILSGRSGPSIGSGPPTPSPSSSSGSISPCPSGHGTCLGLLQPGAHDSSSFLPTVRYTVAGGWANTLDVRGQLDLAYASGGQYTYPDGLTFRDGISIFRRPVAESATSKTPEPAVGTAANDLAQWLASHADLDASVPTRVIVGGASGYRLTVGVPTGTRTAPDHCTTDHREPRCASLFISSDPTATYGFGLVGPEVAVVYLLDLPSGDTVMVVIDDVDGVDQAGLEAAAVPIVNSLSFSP